MVVLLGLTALPAQASWDRVLAYVQPEVEIVHRDDERLVLSRPGQDLTFVLTRQPNQDSHIYMQTKRNRGGNPYRIWIATELLWNNAKFPRTEWGSYFRAEFLRIARPPRTDVAR
ncbi:MAG: hypothetical protein HKO53_07635 [Gemmatimonadetes bacterium]|nr:hypothetical protein [Gemmatimonadota bacterium]